MVPRAIIHRPFGGHSQIRKDVRFMNKTDSIYSLQHQDAACRARTGVIQLPHGPVRTPAFMPVGTNATVKAMTKDGLEEIGFDRNNFV